ncbi:hypothetical protein A2331_01475 [Candidatus Falkowbacteria bacterium RIFOXYB2_FULL_34_18]|uniref:Glycosyltransferase 2-like domain-containing protein n=1 Tax=Candidatus Falkowbacteria bacterium RIFOXYD2_FULL_34_120 TaxID=1798007 RepID=A0A1F5TPR3_9BACT|nr:MAG: hypothetical protein A2331_01475 [Candidatus Falkowbacteria bacterium RIFOXYB2_FULL_34_18]OGF29286.1 MAG: hypothetical protein A2500_05355 [Candidatus Falkowbacteria bacterium RIFOXYC12_FULL_34_55]OGF36402.1 MAG: hypothetical protein A2466_01015 [Candidatus Falkowbacteria bacterium RIFOXYC2_FULL_34_220]OGF38881.1 MAG: hypothetical protein A2515_05775 [Candidatus Falkowbacteria bacterium RIFOXYD12_FULL_34_57]OGF40900.1 MAG: hypothetical protein A2531_04000 [Candidatus Falkowbacteria bact
MPKIFCIIPAFNEENTIRKVIEDVKPFVDMVVVVDDASRDNTFILAKNTGVVVLQHLVNRGQGASLQTGNEYALQNGAELIVHFDADGQFVASDIKETTKPIIEEGYDVVFGSRFLGKKSNIPWFKKNLLFPVARFVNRVLFGVKMTDPQSGFRVLSKKVIQEITIEQDGMAHGSEILAKIFKGGFKIKEVPITVIYYDFGQNFFGGVKIIKDIFLAKLIN